LQNLAMAQLLVVGEDDIGVIFEFSHADVVFHFGVVDFPRQCIPLRILKLILLGLSLAPLCGWGCLLSCFEVRLRPQKVHIPLQGKVQLALGFREIVRECGCHEMVASGLLQEAFRDGLAILVSAQSAWGRRYPKRMRHFMMPNLWRSVSERPFLSRMWVRIALACCGSAAERALLRALRSSSSEAEAPPSKKPAYMGTGLLFAWVWALPFLCWSCAP
jgi:hypothetical protein